MSNTDTRVIDKSDVNGHWTKYLNNETVDRQFNNGDLIILKDPQDRLGPNTYSVAQVVDNKNERIKQLGLFWKLEEARAFAYNRRFPLPEYVRGE